jgi:alginate O-acetyltransferase complex protein AlgI
LNFVSVTFLIFTLATLLIYWIARDRFRTPILLIASYVFYAFWDWRFVSLLIVLTISNYWLAKRMNSEISLIKKKQLLFVCLSLNLLVLATFKYLEFFRDGLTRIFSLIGLNPDIPSISILLPLGLSFLIFQTSSYVIDIYREDMKPEKSFINFATFVVYFPHMAAGPIMPARVLIPQIASSKKRPNFEQVQTGLGLVALGLFRKIVIADTLAPMVNRILNSPDNFDWKSLVIASAGFGLQIYGDFAGYSAIARGVSRLFGIEMMVNFRQPYLATSVTDFWRKWHISLSTWFRDYFYIPLGGNKKNSLRTKINLVIVMTIAGLWHGAAVGFILWGFLHGIFLVLDKYASSFRSRIRKFELLSACFGWLFTQAAVLFAWVFFRNPDISNALHLLSSIINRSQGIFEISDALLLLCALIVSFSLDLTEKFLIPWLQNRNEINKGMLIGLTLIVTLVFKASSVVPFIYFGF